MKEDMSLSNLGTVALHAAKLPTNIFSSTLICILTLDYNLLRYTDQWRSQNAENIAHIKWRLLYQEIILYITSLFKMGTSLKGKNLLPEGANSFL